VLDKKLQIEALTGSNRVLHLEKEVAAKSGGDRASICPPAGCVLGFIVLWGSHEALATAIPETLAA
jgi:hypothetical protein